VVDSSGVSLGSVKDLIIELKNPDGTPVTTRLLGTYLVVESAANEDQRIPVPWAKIQIRQDIQAVVLPVSAAQLTAAPWFNKDVWPASLSADWKTSVQRFWDNPTQPAAALPPAVAGLAPDYLQADKLMGLDVKSSQGVDLGKIEDMAIDWQNSQSASGAQAAQIGYLIFEPDQDLGIVGKLIPMPWPVIPLVPGQEEVTLNFTPDMLRSAPGFNSLALPDLYSSQWVTDLKAFWNR
jgi:sporulation protein YlmC with PRC-barrel domain